MGKRNRVYQGRFKGSSLTHMPNDTFRENSGKMDWASMKPYTCQSCGFIEMVHVLEHKVHRCTKCGSL